MVIDLKETDIQVTKAGFIKIFEAHKNRNTSIQDAYYKAIDYCKANNISPLYTTFESFKTSALYKKKIKK